MANLSSVLAQIRQQESGGNYGITPQQNSNYPISHASGAYQFQPGTWQDWTNRSGIGTQYSEAYQAPPNVQDAVAGYAATHADPNSSGLWGESARRQGIYPPITNIDVTPEQLASADGGVPPGAGSLPIVPPYSTGGPGGEQTNIPPQAGSEGGYGAPGGGTDPGNPFQPFAGQGQYDQFGNPYPTMPDSSQGGAPGSTAGSTLGGLGAGTGVPINVGAQPGLVAAITGWLKSFFVDPITGAVSAALASFQSWVTRAFLLFVGLVILVVALWRIAAPDVTPATVAKAVL